MKKLLRGTDKILMAMAFFGDLYLEGWTKGHGFGRSKSLTESLAIKNSTFRAEVSRFLRTGDIEKVIDKNGRPFLRLSSPGFEKLERMYPLFRLCRRPWDGKWRIVIFDISENEREARDSLRFKLLSLGFGMLQESVYITPLDILADFKEFLKNENLYGKALVFEAKDVFGRNSKLVAAYVWKLNSIANEYEKLLEEADWIERNGEANNDKEKLKKDLFQLLLKDPLLPKELLPDDWPGEKVRSKILSL